MISRREIKRGGRDLLEGVINYRKEGMEVDENIWLERSVKVGRTVEEAGRGVQNSFITGGKQN